jgi:TetR/AcrR family transcriptional regulator, regulator of cefoperazone and chloramphenicol sensitivity
MEIKMRKQRCDGIATRQRLLDAAGRIFAARGYAETTVAEICREAGTNPAAINYYFGAKDALYVQSWRHAFEQSLKNHPFDGGVPADASPEERLRGHIDSFIQRALDEESYSIDMSNRELSSPTGLLSEIRRDSIQRVRESMSRVIAELLGPGANEQDVQFCRRSIMALCFGQLVRRRLHWNSKGRPEDCVETERVDRDEYARHVFEFSIAGIREIGRRLSERGGNRSE